MAFYKQDIVDINLNTGNIHRSFLSHAIGYKNDDADRFGIRTFRDGVPQDLTGASCQAVFMAPNGSKIALTSYGTVSGNVAYVTLPPACYDYEGQFCLAIQLVGGGVTGTMRIVDGMVVNTGASGTVAPTSSVPTYQEIIAQYDAMVAATAAANGAIAATYSGSATYKVGDYCIHDGGLYRCTTAITTAEAWNAAHWTATKIGPDVSDLKSASYEDIIATYKVPYNPTFAMYAGGIVSDGGYDTTDPALNEKRSRTQMFQIEYGQSYMAVLNSEVYHLILGYTYSRLGTTAGVRRIPGQLKDENCIFFTAESNETYMRISFKRNDDGTMDDTDRESIKTALKIYKFTDENLDILGTPADAKITGDNINEINNIIYSLPHYVFDWKVFGKGTTNFPTGWRKGYYNSANGSRNSDSNVSIRTVNLIYGSFISENDLFAEITPPTGYYVRVAVYDGSDNFLGNLNGKNTINVPVRFILRSDRKYAFSVGLFDGDSEDYLTDVFTSSIVLKVYTTDENIYKQNNVKDYIYNSTFEYALKLPEGYHPTGKKTKMIICCHGLSSTVTDSSWGANTVATKFVNVGYAVMDVNQVTTQDWCNPTLIKKFIAALNYIVQNYNVDPVFIYGYSMGSLIGLCLSVTIPGIKATVISGIRLDFDARYAEATESEKAIIDANLGFTNGYDAFIASGWCKTAISCVDANGIKICPSQFPPTSFIYGTTDTLTKAESLAKIDEIKRGGTVCISKEYTGNHSEVCNLSAGTSFDDAVAWLATWG